uniref:Biosynthetic peptidoglycan transglycosylase n=1 Tax=Eiseniibacteriota bacterium TaxID=2212470 RepID=A0A832I491_UNCEI
MRRLAWAAALLGAALAAMVAGAWIAASRHDLSGLETRVPRRTALMAERAAQAAREGRRVRVDHRPVPYARISPILRRAVLVAEDDAFFAHGGLDWNEIQASVRRNVEARRVVRGGSTITQQLAKNLWLGSARTPWRKAEEMFLALRLERALSKRRIFELYLNCIEWGDGIYGAEAAARRHFGVAAADLSPRQAVLLAAVIVNPRRYSPTTPSPRVERRARLIAARLHRRGVLDEAGLRAARGEAPRPAPPAYAAPDTAAAVAPRDSAAPGETPPAAPPP